MLTIRNADERGHADFGWLDSRHSFSFGHYFDPRHMGVSVLRVINEDRVAPGGGFPPHGHQDMEIISYVLDGALEHRDSMGNQSVIRPGEVQLMSAGSGVTHSEYNGLKDEPVHFLQIWLLPSSKGGKPGYQQQRFEREDGAMRLVVSPDGAEGSLLLRQDARIYRVQLKPGERLQRELAPGRTYYWHLAKGRMLLNDRSLGHGDGATLSGEAVLDVTASDAVEALFFDLP